MTAIRGFGAPAWSGYGTTSTRRRLPGRRLFGKTPSGKVSLANAAARRLLRGRGKGTQTNMSILAWLVVGLIAGFLAKYVVPGEGPGGILGDIIIGIIGAFIGGWIFHAFGESGVNGLTPWSILVAFVGAAVLLFIMRAISGRRATY